MTVVAELPADLYPALSALIRAQLAVWPDHRKALTTRFRDDSLEFLERSNHVAQLALTLMGDEIDRYCRDYQWMCERFLEERLHFQREGDYRLKTFADAEREVYSNADFMGRYMRGLLVSQLLWRNHAAVIDLFRTAFLAPRQQSLDYLEVGPGHGLFFYFAAQNPAFKTLTGWDVSDSSIAATAHAMKRFNVSPARFSLTQQDILDADCPANRFDTVVISEVLEHLELPEVALRSLHKAMRKQGCIFVNVPVNSPAPDHIYLWREPSDVAALVVSCGFTIEQEHYLPIAGYTLEQSRKHASDVSCVIIARKF